jgi:NAD(P)-dependent dehydrogenase (short-subunit alcohol dehydrogenase family)
MQIDLTGKTALITGSTAIGGIGFTTAVGLRDAGATVVINGRSADRVQAAVEALGGGDQVTGVAADVSTAAGSEALIRTLPLVDILVNNAGGVTPQSMMEIPDEEWEHQFAFNVMSGLRLSRHFLPGMAERGWGRVVFVSSDAALNIPMEMPHYGVTKLAQLGLARGLAEAFPASGGVTVNSVLPGATMTPALVTVLGQLFGDEADSPEAAGQLLIDRGRPTSLLGRPAAAEEVANLIVYLSSPQASATTGTSVRVDGGVVRMVV